MTAQDFDKFSRLVSGTCRMLSRGSYVPDGEDLKQWFRILRRYSLEAVHYGLNQHMDDPVAGRFAPAPAEIAAKIEARLAQDGRPGAEEAWARSLLALDEQQTVVWTEEMAEAFAVAKPLLMQRDVVGARMAFRETYARLIEGARANRELPNWLVSEGHDPALRAVAVQSAIKAGSLALQQGERYLALPAPRQDLGAVGAATASNGPPRGVRSILLALREQLVSGRAQPSADAIARRATDSARAQARALVESNLAASDE